MQSQILPSRAALVDRIALQFEYGQNLIVLLGTSGLGKSYLLETFITDKYNDFNKAFVQVGAQMTDVQLMTQLLEQSFNAPLIDNSSSSAISSSDRCLPPSITHKHAPHCCCFAN